MMKSSHPTNDDEDDKLERKNSVSPSHQDSIKFPT